MSCENIEEVVEVVARGLEVLEDKDKFIKWLKRPNIAMGGKTPLSMLDSSDGTQLVLTILGRIETGVYS